MSCSGGVAGAIGTFDHQTFADDRTELAKVDVNFGCVAGGGAAVHPDRLHLGLSCRCLYGAVRQQCAGHLPFERQARANGGFSILPTGSTDP